MQALHTGVHRDKAYLKHLKTTFHCHPTHNMLECVYNVKLAGSDDISSSEKGAQGKFLIYKRVIKEATPSCFHNHVVNEYLKATAW